jgi:HEAT repeat protein
VRQALSDADVLVRCGAVFTLAALDFDWAARELRLSAETQNELINAFYTDPEEFIRGLIVMGLADDRDANSPDVLRLLTEAFRDAAPAVREAAATGAARLGPVLGVSLLRDELSDVDAGVRRQAASQLGTFGARAADLLPALETAYASEADPQASDAVRNAILAIRGGGDR